MSTKNESKQILKESMLFWSLLKANEIRYTDLLSFLIQELEYNPFIQGLPKLCKTDYNTHREYLKTDLWIVKKDGEKNKGKPYILIENKLKSIPYDDQLKKYSKKFVKEYFSYFKRELKESMKNKGMTYFMKNKLPLEEIEEFKKSCMKELKFIVLLPYENTVPSKTVKVSINDIEKDNTYEILCKWEYQSYGSLGDKILPILDKAQIKKTSYMYKYFNDFANVLCAYKDVKYADVIPEASAMINEVMTPSTIFKNLELEILYDKIMASHLAGLLKDSLGKPDFQSIAPEDLNSECDGYIAIHHTYTTSALFEVGKKLGNELFYLIQYQAGQLRKGLVVKTKGFKESDKFKKFIEAKWDKDFSDQELTIKKETAKKFDKRYHWFETGEKKEYIWYLTIYKIIHKDVKDDLTVEKLVDIMARHIKEDIF